MLHTQLSRQKPQFLNTRIFLTTDFRTHVYWTLSARNEPKNTSLSYGHPTAGDAV